MEAVSNEVRLLCWPYFADQFLNERYICDERKTGLRLDRDSRGLITLEEIKLKVDQLLDSGEFSKRARDLKERIGGRVREGGESHKNFSNLVDWIKA